MIGIFDSGSGGLTVLKAIRERFPSCDVVYFGDIAHMPYGSKSAEELLELVVHGIEVLQAHGATKIVCACNSVSASMALSLLDATDLEPMHTIEMVGPTVSYFKNTDYRILLCATPATVRSGIYQSAFRLIGKDIETLAIPDLAPAIEFNEGTVENIVTTAFEKSINTDVVILACTHYPLVIEQFKKALPPGVAIFDPAVAVAVRVYKQFWPQEVGEGTTKFLLSKDSPQFKTLVQKLFPDAKYLLEVVE